ncbi:MAG TPA: aminotransferase class I/II-fold pyridoxal phosphate-dependent enzyme, partial [Burkholderiaceae bacterium]|nr:aminotransferase class I/II-fold pyridoxal phosphate-dependent enzyme [Burkholderiaceae bacterium]
LDEPAMHAAIAAHRPAIVWLAYPNNPTGNCFADDAIERIVSAAPGLVVIDEAYQPFALRSWMPRLASAPNLLVMRTISKLGLAGLRIGYLAGAHDWIDELEKLRPPYNVGALNEAAAEFALEHLDVLDAQAAQLRSDRERLIEALAALPGVVPFASQANFVLIRVPQAAAVAARLRERRVLIKDVGRMHPLLADCLRLTVGTPQENRLLLQALSDSVAETAKSPSDAHR